MSASLVGSEMCIRDSHPSGARGARPSWPLPVVAEARSEHLRGASRRAVSYTHLTLPTICSV
eukprot:3336211-Alexandrium_andersonii.AAC.1